MSQYSFLYENKIAHVIHDKLNNIHFGNGYAFVDNYQSKKTISEFIASLITSSSLQSAIDIYKSECKKMFFLRIPSKYLKSIGNILKNSTEDDFREKLKNYLDISFK